MTILDGQVLKKEVVKETSLKGNTHYSLVFTIHNKQNRISLFLGPNKKSTDKEIAALIVPGETYKFYIDPTVTKDGDVQGGIRRIDENGKVIFKESNAFNIYGGISFVLISIVGLVILQKFGFKKNGS
jgi:hypothetical protein